MENTIDKFKAELSERLVELMDSERGVQTKLAKSIGKTGSYFSEIKRGNPVNAAHLKAVGLIFGPEVVVRLLGLPVFDGSGPEERPEQADSTLSVQEKRIIPQNQREGILSNFNDRERARETILNLIELEKLDPDFFLTMAGEIRGAVRALRPKKRHRAYLHAGRDSRPRHHGAQSEGDGDATHETRDNVIFVRFNPDE